MHDCPGCRVPLHGHESFCPVCGLKQTVRPEFRGSLEKYDKSASPVGLIVLFVVLAGLIVFAVQNSWIGQLMQRGPEKPLGDSALSAPQAREKLEGIVLQNLNGQSNLCKFVYMDGEKTVDRNYPDPVQLTIDVNLKDPSIRKSIVEPAKGLMEPGKVNSLVLSDAHSHATITYNIASGGSEDASDVPASDDDTQK
jgi:hypothetical protein